MDVTQNALAKDSGDASSAAIHVESTAGTLDVFIAENTFDLGDADIRAVRAVARVDGAQQMRAVNNKLDGQYGTGVELVGQHNALLTASVWNNTFDGAFEHGIVGTAAGSSQLHLGVGAGNTFNDPSQYGVWVNQTDTSRVTTGIAGSTFNGTTGDAGVLLQSSGAAGSWFNAVVSSNTFNLTGGQDAIRAVGTNSANMVVDLVKNTSAAALDNGMVVSAAGNAHIDLFVWDNEISGATNNGLSVEALGSSTILARVFDNPNVTGNAGSDIVFTANGGSILLNLLNNADGGTIDLFRPAGSFQVHGNPVADNPGAVLFLDAGILINTGWDN